MGLFDFLRPKVVYQRVHDSDYNNGRTFNSGKAKYGHIHYNEAGYTDYSRQRENARGVYADSLIARGIVRRLVDNVINTGLTRECTPIWNLIPGVSDWDDEKRYQWTEDVEKRWQLYTESKEPDIKGMLTFQQLQASAYALRVKEGETFAICRYMNSPARMNPLSLQILNNDQIQQPYDNPTLEAIKARKSTVKEGIEYDSTGHMVAIYVRDDLSNWSEAPKRVPMFGPKSGRRFVIYDANEETPEQFRGFPELSAMVYELDRLTEMSITEIENSIASALWFAAIETEVGGEKKHPINPAGSNFNIQVDEVSDGLSQVRIGKRALLMQNLGKGQKLKPVQPQHPNPNYAAFVEIHENMICSAIGMPLSVYRQKFQGSYSAARAEILFFWNNVIRRRSDFAYGFLDPAFEAWFSEEVDAGNIKAPGFKTLPIASRAWLAGTWNGISRPVVDPVKEVNAVKMREDLGHTTGEREAKAHNGSSFRENIERLKKENELRREANQPIDPELAPDTPTDDPAPGGGQ